MFLFAVHLTHVGAMRERFRGKRGGKEETTVNLVLVPHVTVHYYYPGRGRAARA